MNRWIWIGIAVAVLVLVLVLVFVWPGGVATGWGIPEWIANKEAATTVTTTSTTVSSTTGPITCTITGVSSAANVRDDDGNFVGTIAQGKTVTVFETKNGYTRIEVNRWVASEFISCTKTTNNTSVDTTADSDIVFGDNEEHYVPAGYVVTGDIEVEKDGKWLALYDTGPASSRSGLITVFSKETKIRALWGAWGTSGNTDVEKIRQRMLDSGCGDFCDSVAVVEWPQ